MSEPKKWFDEDGLLHLEPLPSDRVENSILYSVTYWLLYGDRNRIYMSKILQSLERDGILYDNPQFIGDPCSHDNMTAIITMMVILDMPIDHIKITKDYAHPRDLIYMGYLKGKWWAYPLLPILFIIFTWTAITKYKVRGDEKIFKTDTEILYWIRTHLPSSYRFIHWTGPYIVGLLKRKFGVDWVQSMMDVYYRNPDHPNRNYPK